MKVLAFNSSPNMEHGGTALILAPFLAGMESAGAEVELVYVRRLDIKPCEGCFNCWLVTPGVCVQNDDMASVLSKLARADIVVIATPIYVDGMTSTMKTLLDRCLPLVVPYFEIRDDHCRHPAREGVKVGGKLALVSVSGFTEMDNFAPLLVHVQAICRNFGWEYSGALLRPTAASLPALKQLGLPVDDVFEAARQAGYQLVRHGAIAPGTLATVSREIIPREQYVVGVNAHFQQQLDTLKERPRL